MTVAQQLEKMRLDWDHRARENALHYVATLQPEWTDADFFASGEETVRNFILTDMENICQGRQPSAMRVLEIGCGAGRITRALANLFGEVHAVDVSGEMIALARRALAHLPNAHVHQTNGKDLDVLSDMCFDFAFSCIVFQHIPSREIIQSYVEQTAVRLATRSLFKFQVQGCSVETSPDNTWVGVGFTEHEARAMAHRAGCEMRYAHGANTQDFWLWFFRL